MMRMSNINMRTKVEKDKLLATLRTNLERHSGIVKEALQGYVAKARIAVEKRLKMLEAGTAVTLQFSLTPPQDHSEVYRTAIQMLEWNTSPYVELAPDEFRQLVLDEWDWTSNFVHSNAVYSGTAKKWLDEAVGGSLVAPPDND